MADKRRNGRPTSTETATGTASNGNGNGNGTNGNGNGHSAMRLSGKVAIITGAGRGIGHATSLKFGKEGAIVITCDINADQAQQAAKDVNEAGGEAIGLPDRRQGSGEHHPDGRCGGREIRAHRLPGQQCRHRPGQHAEEHDRGAVRQRDRNQSEGRLQLHQGGGGRHAQAEAPASSSTLHPSSASTATSARPTMRPASSA